MQNPELRLSRGDIVVFKYPPDPSKRYIKRLIGLPGDQIEIKSGGVWLNGVKLAEPYLTDHLNLSRRSQPLLTVPAHAYFFMGDNRDNSNDSRIFGQCPKNYLMQELWADKRFQSLTPSPSLSHSHRALARCQMEYQPETVSTVFPWFR